MKRLSILLMLLFLTGCAASPIETSEPTLPTPMTEATQPDPTETTVAANCPHEGDRSRHYSAP